MSSSENINQTYYVPTSDITTTKGSDLKGAAQSFFDAMNTLIKQYADPTGSMTIYGITLTGEEKYGVIGTTLFNQFMTDNGNAVETLFSVESFIVQLEKELGKMS